MLVSPSRKVVVKHVSSSLNGLDRVLGALRQRYPITAVAGHEHVAPGRKFDPGAGFDWPRLMATLAMPTPDFPEAVLARR